MAVATSNGDLIAVDQRVRRVVKMSIAEPACEGDGGSRIHGLNCVHNCRICQPGNVPNGAELIVAKTAARHAAALQTHAAGSQPESGYAAVGSNLEGTVGYVAERIGQGSLSSTPSGHGFQTGSLQFPNIIRTGVERPTAKIFEEEIALGPKLLQIKST